MSSNRILNALRKEEITRKMQTDELSKLELKINLPFGIIPWHYTEI